MGDRLTSLVTVATMAAAVSGAISVLATRASPASSNAVLKTPWREPDLQGIWTEDCFVEVLRADATCPEAADSSEADFTTDDAVFATHRSSSRASGPKTPTEPATLPV